MNPPARQICKPLAKPAEESMKNEVRSVSAAMLSVLAALPW
jgi:hypothetical protein